MTFASLYNVQPLNSFKNTKITVLVQTRKKERGGKREKDKERKNIETMREKKRC